MYIIFSPSPPISALVEKRRLVNRKNFVFSGLQRQNLLLLSNERFRVHFSGHVNTHNVLIWSLENSHEELESQRESPKLNVFSAISWRKVYGLFVFGEPTISAYLDALQLWLFPQLKEIKPDNFIWQQDGAPPHWHLSVSYCFNVIVIDQLIFRKSPHYKACFAWPPRSPNLTPWDFYLWELIRDCVYVPPLPADLPDLRHRIEAAVARITSDTLNNVWDELVYRLDEYRVTNETHIKHL
ncbi:uncharacterized protein TNCV_4196011 [Trichonephila clavipes]|nr:uncharacterized protein TNCV_4196011 [Trichonephila clavipes]